MTSAERIEQEATGRNLMTRGNPPWTRYFYFDVHSIGAIYTPAECEKVLELLFLARKQESHPSIGVHIAMLASWTFPAELKNDRVHWRRPVPWKSGIAGTITLRAWLSAQGHPYKP